jgi:hypothetical protein
VVLKDITPEVLMGRPRRLCFGVINSTKELMMILEKN